jgi:hypothetical protein
LRVTQALSKKVGEQTGSDGKRQEDQQALSVVLALEVCSEALGEEQVH